MCALLKKRGSASQVLRKLQFSKLSTFSNRTPVIGYPRDFHVNYARFNGFLSNVCYSFQNLGKALRTFSLKRSSKKTFLIPKFVIDTIN